MTDRLLVGTDSWIIDQITGIRKLEGKVAHAIKAPRGARKGLRHGVEQLNTWVNQVDTALSARAGLIKA